MRISNEIERYRARRTLSEVRRKLQEALRLSRLLHERTHEQTTVTHRHR